MEEKRLVRSKDRWIAGICGGIAEYFNLSKDRVRLAWLILTLVLGVGFWAYIILWLLMPEQNNNLYNNNNSNNFYNSNNNYNKV